MLIAAARTKACPEVKHAAVPRVAVRRVRALIHGETEEHRKKGRRLIGPVWR